MFDITFKCLGTDEAAKAAAEGIRFLSVADNIGEQHGVSILLLRRKISGHQEAIYMAKAPEYHKKWPKNTYVLSTNLKSLLNFIDETLIEYTS